MFAWLKKLFHRKAKQNPKHAAIFNAAVKHITDPTKLNALADAFDQKASDGKEPTESATKLRGQAIALRNLATMHGEKPGKPRKPRK